MTSRTISSFTSAGYLVFIASKLIALLTQPLAWVVMLLIGSLLVRRKPALAESSWAVGVGFAVLGLVTIAKFADPPS
ncbi:MAG: hypothetical protein IPQ22_04210 [Rhodoferax sp.]|nr:hypothetical protein [Rhodoferax sp.]